MRTLPQLLGGGMSTQDTDSAGQTHAGPMPIGLWLKRLALPQHYGDTLRAMNVQYVVDLKSLSESDVLEIMDIKNVLHKARVSGFLSGDDAVLTNFALAKSTQVDDLFRKYNPSAAQTQVDQFVSLVPSDSLSSFEIDYFLAKFAGAPRRMLDHIDELLQDASVTDSRSLLERSMARAAALTVEQFLIDNNAPKEAIAKFAEEEIDDIEQLLEMGDDLEEFGIKSKGAQFRIKKAIERLKKEQELCA